MLSFEGRWRYESPGSIPLPVLHKFDEFIGRIASQGNRWHTLELFKTYFAGAAGSTSSWSSSESWAESDLNRYMHQAAENGPMFIEAFYDACVAINEKEPQVVLPDLVMINRVLREHESGYEIQPPNLILGSSSHKVIVADRHEALDEQAQRLIQESLKQSERLLTEGRNRQAVTEILWLLETLSTAFRGLDVGDSTVQGKYFNKIAAELRKHHKGKLLDQVLDWATTLHGYLSSPTGGAIRHGADIKNIVDMQPSEAQLYCNLIRSYINFLMAEHARIARS